MSDSVQPSESPAGLILLTGASGYVGGRLLAELERGGLPVRCLSRRPEFLASRTAAGTEVVAGDVLNRASLDAAMSGVRVVYYLVHSMDSTGSFEEEDRLGARNFGDAARSAGVERIVYLGGLGNDDAALSPHLRSRQEVGHILRRSGVPVFEFRASIVIGSGSLSFELIRSLTERLPIMLLPRWVATPAQPIAIEDVVSYLVAARSLPVSRAGIYEIGGADRVSYADIMRAYADERGIRVPMIPVPVLTPFLSSLWLGLITPIYARVGRTLIESIVHPTIVRDDSALTVFDIRPMGMKDALRRALVYEDREYAQTRWSDAISSAGRPQRWGGQRFGNRLVDSRVRDTVASPEAAFAPIQRIGGDRGWYAWNGLWWLRGILDLLVGGVGMRRGRADSVELRVGDTLDFWRVERFEPNHLLRLTAEMKLPGRAWLEFEVLPREGGSTIRQTAVFDPVGVFGQLYWYTVFPLHELVFGGMLRNIARAAEKP